MYGSGVDDPKIDGDDPSKLKMAMTPQNFISHGSLLAAEINRNLKNQVYHAANKSGLITIARNRISGRGTILMFHEIQDDPASELMTGVSTRFLDTMLTTLEQDGWEFLTMEEGIKRAADRDHAGKRFVILTFDDGYRDNFRRALPILERHSAPFILFVPTGAVTRELYSWWLGLRRLLQNHDVIEIEPMGRRLHCSEPRSKVAALNAITHWVAGDYHRKASLKPTLDRSGISLMAVNEQYFLNEEELKIIAKHPLATVGAHTVTHCALSILDDTSAREEMSANRAYLQNLLQLPVLHFAYPYGDVAACGPREGMLAEKVGFSTAVTSRRGQLWPEHAHHVHALPRVAVKAGATVSPYAWMFDVWASHLRRTAKGIGPVVTW